MLSVDVYEDVASVRIPVVISRSESKSCSQEVLKQLMTLDSDRGAMFELLASVPGKGWDLWST
jgi:hypothetical protein